MKFFRSDDSREDNAIKILNGDSEVTFMDWNWMNIRVIRILSDQKTTKQNL